MSTVGRHHIADNCSDSHALTECSRIDLTVIGAGRPTALKVWRIALSDEQVAALSPAELRRALACEHEVLNVSCSHDRVISIVEASKCFATQLNRTFGFD